ncbi:carboxypeptidase regulatory-like domain-containing protein, partial [bacterium]|nr:carboxypeptidase regulatory-like domain-containing protein [bacterium]
MPAHVYPYHKNPANDTQKKVGFYAACYLQIRNDGNEAAQSYLGINKDGSECGKHIYNVWLEPGAAKNANPCEFTMPDRRVKIEYFGGHHDGNVWVEDFSDVIYIDPEIPVVERCSQTVKVVDPTGRPVQGSRIHLRNGTISYGSTDSSGLFTFTNLAKDRTHYVSAEKSGYSSSGTKSFTACTGTITLLLGVSCVCTEWVKQECIRDGVRKYTRTCTPSGCRPEVRTISDSSCIGAVPPEEKYVNVCGPLPTQSDSYCKNWWKCAYGVGEAKGICTDSSRIWSAYVQSDIREQVGVWPHHCGGYLTGEADGDYTKLTMRGFREPFYLGRFKWKCPEEVP